MIDTAPIDTAPSWTTALTTWTPTPVVDVLIVATTVCYLLLVRRHGAGSRWPWRRSVAWVLAMAVLVIALDSAVAGYGDVLFWVHMVQHLLLIMVVPVLLVWAQPLRLVGSATGPRGQDVLDRLVGSRAARSATAPLFGLALYAAVVVLTHLTGFQQLSVTHGWVRAVELVLYLVSGYLFFLPLAGTELGRESLPYLFRFVLLALGMGVDTLSGVTLMLTGRPLAPAYAASHPGWGPGALADQGVAGAVMWFGGDLLMMVLIVVVAVQWGLADQEKQGLGGWLEGVRRRALLGGDSEGLPGGVGDGGDVDADQRALDAYNAALSALHGLPAPRRGPGPRA